MLRTPLAMVLLAGLCACAAVSIPEDTSTAVIPGSTVATTTSLPSTTTSTVATTTSRGSLLIQGTGDVNLDPAYLPVLATHGWDHAWSGLHGLFLEDDLTVINLECAPSAMGAPEPKDHVFRCPPESLPSLLANGIDVANIGNNHSGDYGKEALVDGRENLIDAGVAPVGAGRDAAEAGAPAIFEIAGWKVAVLGFGGIFPNDSWVATEEVAGMRDGDDIESMVAAVREAATISDLVVVAVHWGVELDTTPRPDDVERATAMIGAGADIIFGHHPHRLQPLDVVDGKPVFWSLGNFVWPNFSSAGSTTAVARVTVAPDGTIEACLIPALIESHGHPVLTGGSSCRSAA